MKIKRSTTPAGSKRVSHRFLDSISWILHMYSSKISSITSICPKQDQEGDSERMVASGNMATVTTKYSQPTGRP